MKITTTSVKQAANEILGVNEKTLYYLIIENKNGSKLIVNVGQKTHDNVLKLTAEENDKEVLFNEKTTGIKGLEDSGTKEIIKGGKK